MATITDRRGASSDRYYSSRERFLDRYRGKVKEAIDRSLGNSTIEDIGKGGVDVTIPNEDIQEPFIHHGQGGVNERVLPGNKEFQQGDRHAKPKGGGGGRGGKPGQGEGEDSFRFRLTEEEYFEHLMRELQLPNLVKEGGEDAQKFQYRRAGLMNEGPPARMDILRSRREQIARHMGVGKVFEKQKLTLLLELRDILQEAIGPEKTKPLGLKSKADIGLIPFGLRIKTLEKDIEKLFPLAEGTLGEEQILRMEEIDAKLGGLAAKIGAIPKWNENDLKFRKVEPYPKPISQAVMFCLMDVSGSMDEQKKNNAKLFYMLLHRFLKRNYAKVDVVFVRHTNDAQEVDEKTFFYDTASGGTTVSSVIVKMQDIIKDRYPLSEWNIYGAQASDGDNDTRDNAVCQQRLQELLPDVQGYFYTEVTDPPQRQGSLWGNANGNSSLWDAYAEVAKVHNQKFFLGKIKERKDIWPVFRDFFQKREKYEPASRPAGFAALEPQDP